MGSGDKPDADCCSPRILFVLGTCRSGSSLLYALLNRHPAIRLMYEADVLSETPFPRWECAPGFWHRIDFWSGSLARHGLSWELMGPTPVSRREMALRLYRTYGNRPGVLYLGEKSVHYAPALGKIRRWFPEARFIFLHRDMRAVVRSIQRAGATAKYFSKWSTTVRGLMDGHRLRCSAAGMRAAGLAVLELQYESLLDDIGGAMREVCEFLQIGYDPSMTDLGGANLSAVPEAKHHAALRSRVIRRRDCPEERPARFVIAKAARYEASAPHGGAGEPRVEPVWFALERLVDMTVAWLLRRRDDVVRLLYSVAPLGLMRRYRIWRLGCRGEPSWWGKGSG